MRKSKNENNDGGRRAILSASIMCADALDYGKALDEIAQAGIQYIHCDIMDNHFVPNLMLPPEILNRFRARAEIPFDYHIMAEDPASIINRLDAAENDLISVHYESTYHLQSAIEAVKAKGAKAAVALNPATPPEMLSCVLCCIDAVLIMTVNPGFSGQKMVPSGFDKIKRTRKMLDDAGYNDIIIEVDGNCSFENIPKMYKNGADMFVVGTSSVFAKNTTVKDGTERVFKMIDNIKR